MDVLRSFDGSCGSGSMYVGYRGLVVTPTEVRELFSETVVSEDNGGPQTELFFAADDAASFRLRQRARGIDWTTVRFPTIALAYTPSPRAREVRRCSTRRGHAPTCHTRVVRRTTVTSTGALVGYEHRPDLDLYRWVLRERSALAEHGLVLSPALARELEAALQP